MHVQFIARGTGSARAAADYLLGEPDSAGQPRAGVEVLRGDPEQVAAVADLLEFEHKYRSAVTAWSPEDRPIRPAARRLQSRARLEPAGRPGAGEDVTARPSRLHRGGEAADRPGTRSRSVGVDPRPPHAARRERRRAEPR